MANEFKGMGAPVHVVVKLLQEFALPLVLCGALALSATVSQARQFRTIAPIATPERLPEGAERIARFSPVDPRLVRKAVFALASAWNTGRLDPMLSPDRFYNKDRLLDTISEVAPRDAKLTVQSVAGVTTLEQYFQPRRGYRQQVSIVSAIVFTQLEFTDTRQGFIRLEGRNEFVLEIAQRASGG